MAQTRYEVAFYNEANGWITDCAFDKFRGALRYIVDVTAALSGNDKPLQARVIHSETQRVLAHLQIFEYGLYKSLYQPANEEEV